jgi:hypothetical protein
MKRKLLLLAAVLSLSFVVSAEARPPLPPMYIACETCMTTAPYVCQCGPNTFHPGAMSDCSAWFSVCY